ncbi:MAG: alkaline phosphatase [bacterium]
MKRIFGLLVIGFFILLNGNVSSQIIQEDLPKGNVVFIHPDGTGLTTWNAMRVLYYGPDATCNWDKLSNIGLYRSHVKDCLTSTSHAGGTIHAYGVKVAYDSYGLDGDKEITARSGKKMSIMDEAIEAGIKTGLINTGSINEPGTSAMIANVVSRGMSEEIAKQLVQSGVDLIFCGGEEWLLPEGIKGFHTASGKRKDGLNLIEQLKANGYKVIYTKEELQNIPANVNKLFGVFAEGSTFNDVSEEEQNKLGLKNYKPEAPTIAEMTKTAVAFLSRSNNQFFLMAEEEGTDNLGNHCNARGMLEALKRADDAVGVALDFMNANPNTLILTAADSEAGGIDMLGDKTVNLKPGNISPEKDTYGAPFDGVNGTSTPAFLSAPDQFGNRFLFTITWSSNEDGYGSVVSRAEGPNAELMRGSIDNTDIYKVMYATLFGKLLK